jgi:antitoxin component YwqK of YwqJK toxin-antitoxin module
MKFCKFAPLLALVFLASCEKNTNTATVVSEQYLHKYGYAVSKQEWNDHYYPGQVVSQLSNGIVVTTSYEAGVKHGPTTYTYPDSKTIEKTEIYDRDRLVKEIHFDQTGRPMWQKVNLSPARYEYTAWFKEGNPRCVEEFAGEELLEARYFNLAGDVEAKVEKGFGQTIQRDAAGNLVAKSDIQTGFINYQEIYYSSGALKESAQFKLGILNGERKLFLQNGEPSSVEEYVDGLLHGKTTHFRSGVKHYEVSYLFGSKNGFETHFVDGEHVAHQICWENNVKHGPEVFYMVSGPVTHYYYQGDELSKSRYDEMVRLDEMISQIQN